MTDTPAKPVVAWGIVGPDGALTALTGLPGSELQAWWRFEQPGDDGPADVKKRLEPGGYRAIPLTVVPADAGYAVVPVEPSFNMVRSGRNELRFPDPNADKSEHVRQIYRAMLAASSEEGKTS